MGKIELSLRSAIILTRFHEISAHVCATQVPHYWNVNGTDKPEEKRNCIMSASHSLRSSHIDIQQKQGKYNLAVASNWNHFDFSGGRKRSAANYFGNIFPLTITSELLNFNRKGIYSIASNMNSILVTGCSRGIGLGLIKVLVNSSKPLKHIIATCRNPEKALVNWISQFFLLQLSILFNFCYCAISSMHTFLTLFCTLTIFNKFFLWTKTYG